MSDQPIPAAALAHHIAILGKTGSGKSNAAKTVVEAALDRGERVCVLDPTGSWYGLRLARNGKPSPYPVVIFGGAHADIPVAGAHGAAIAETVGTSSTPAVIDTRLMTVGERTRFFTDFAEALLRKNRGPLTLVIDEAHLFAPQGRVSDPQSGKMLHAANNLVSLGRSIGLRVIMLSQRPAKLHKDSLTQIETLVAMRLIAPQDRAAIDAWIGEWADPAKGREIVASLPSLPTGDAWIWSPEIGVLKRDHFPLARTFDSGKAPEAGEEGPGLAPIDLAEVTSRLERVAADVVANDPRALKAEVARLTKLLASAGAPVDPASVKAAEEAVFLRGVEEGERRGNIAGQAVALSRVRSALDALGVVEQPTDGAAAPAPRTRPVGPARAVPAPVRAAPPFLGAEAGFTGPQNRVLEAVAFWLRLGFEQPTRAQVGAAAGYSPSSGGFANLLGQLRGAGLLDYPAPNCVRLTQEGRIAVPASTDERTAPERASTLLSAPQAKVFVHILKIREGSRTEIAEATDYSPTSGGFANLLGSMRTIGLIDYPSPGQVRAADWLFS